MDEYTLQNILNEARDFAKGNGNDSLVTVKQWIRTLEALLAPHNKIVYYDFTPHYDRSVAAKKQKRVKGRFAK